MYNIRKNIFETNSSSTHSVSISKRLSNCDFSRLENQLDDCGKLHIVLCEFG